MLELRQHFPLADLLSVAGLPRSTFYYQWRAGQAGDKYASLKARDLLPVVSTKSM